jgi:hypothetical protein
MTGDWTDRIDNDMRRCANPQWLGCVMLVLSFIGGIVLGWAAWMWVSCCP